jgi:hypothetical protein
MSDAVNHPQHYNSFGIECIEVVEHFDFVTGNIIKYAWRAGLKESTTRLEDLRKCEWYVKRALEQEMKNAEISKT